MYLFSFLGYATHGLLDACTSYGTQLLWPFSDARIAWNSVSIIDPLFTLPVIALIAAAAISKKPLYARIAFVYAVIFLAAGLIQKMRAEQSLYELAESRGHQVERLQVKPTFGNRHVWKLIYESGDRYYVDAVRLLLEPTIIEGDSIRKLDVKRDFPWLPEDSQHARDIKRFRWFSDGFVAVHKDNPSVIFDVRYSFVPNQIDMMWGIELDPQAIRQGMLKRHVKYQMRSTQDKDNRDAFINMVMRF
jgi:inner membrane protein